MSDFFSKIENFLFDIIGLTLPGLLFLLLILLPIHSLNFPTNYINPNTTLNNAPFISFAYFIHSCLQGLAKNNPNYVIAIIIIIAFILGHLIKVFSVLFYDVFSAVFDHGVNKPITHWYSAKATALANYYQQKFGGLLINSSLYKTVKAAKKPIKRHIIEIFVFTADPYMKDNEKIKEICLNELKTKTGDDFPDKWYSIYKISSILVDQNETKSKAAFFLSKYNLYRSLSLIFFFSFFYYIIFFRKTSSIIPTPLKNSEIYIFLLLFFLWYTFHNKYKRYWTLCGNEALMSLYYFLNKSKLSR